MAKPIRRRGISWVGGSRTAAGRCRGLSVIGGAGARTGALAIAIRLPPRSELPPSPTDGAGGTPCTASPEPAPENKPARWAASEPPAPPRDGGDGTTCTPALESEPPDREPTRPLPVELPAFSIACTDGGGGTTLEPEPDSRPPRPAPGV